MGGFSPIQLQGGHYSPVQRHAQHAQQHGEPMQASQHYAPMHATPSQHCGPMHAPQHWHEHWRAMPAPPPNVSYSQMAPAIAAGERFAMLTPPSTLQEKFATYVMCDYTPRDPIELPMSLWASTGRLIRQLQPHAPVEVAQLGNSRLKQLISEWYTNHPLSPTWRIVTGASGSRTRTTRRSPAARSSSSHSSTRREGRKLGNFCD